MDASCDGEKSEKVNKGKQSEGVDAAAGT